MPTRETTIRRPQVTQQRCPACGWFSGWLARLGFRTGERIRVIEAYRFVALVAGDLADDRELPASAAEQWPWLVAQAGKPEPKPKPPKPEEKGGSARVRD